jgi:hypothetical protein
MRADLDGQVLTLDRPTLAGAFQAGIAEAERRGLFIVAVMADGKPLEPEAFAQPSDEVGAYQTVTFVGAKPAELVEDALRQAAAAVEGIARSQPAVAELIQSGNTPAALDHLREVFGTWMEVRDAVERSGRLLGREFAAEALPGLPGDAPVKACIEALAAALASVKAALEHQDWSRLADLIGHELDVLARTWKRMLDALADSVAADRRTGGEAR